MAEQSRVSADTISHLEKEVHCLLFFVFFNEMIAWESRLGVGLILLFFMELW